jgi:hypothetical protein
MGFMVTHGFAMGCILAPLRGSPDRISAAGFRSQANLENLFVAQ